MYGIGLAPVARLGRSGRKDRRDYWRGNFTYTLWVWQI